MTALQTTCISDDRQNTRFGRHAFYAWNTKEGTLRYGGGWKMLWSAVHGREYTLVALLIPTRAFLRTCDEEKPRRVLCLSDMQVERAGRYRADRVHLSRPLFFFLLRLPSFFTSSLFLENLVLFRQSLPSWNFDEFKFSFVIICTIYLTIDSGCFVERIVIMDKKRKFICCITLLYDI